MAESRSVVRVFLASPGDLQHERRAARTVAERFNQLWADQLGYQIDLVGWEETVTRFGRPQELINRDVERCELFIGLMWKKWGTAPDLTGQFTSGFEEEFRTSVARRAETGTPEISLLFKKVDPAQLADPGEELKKVTAFRDQIISGKLVYFEEFDALDEFNEKFERCIVRYVQSLWRMRDDEDQAALQEPPKAGTRSPENPPAATLLPVSAAGFARDFIDAMEHASTDVAADPLQVARFRLIGSVLNSGGNDHSPLGVHDANIMFQARGDIALSDREIRGLIVSGLDHFSSENVPIWHWLTKLPAIGNNTLAVLSATGETSRRVGALSAMRLLSDPINVDGLNREDYVGLWFAEDCPNAVRLAALNYLSDCGTIADLDVILAEYERGDTQTAKAAIEAILWIKFRESQDVAIDALLSLQPDRIDSALLQRLLERSEAIDDDALRRMLQSPSAELRARAAELLWDRRALIPEDADRLLADSNVEARSIGLRCLAAAGRPFSSEAARNILVRPARRNNLLSAWMGSDDVDGRRSWAEYQHDQLKSLPDRELEDLVSESIGTQQAPRFALYDKRFSKYARELRTAVDDRFTSFFAARLRELKETLPDAGELIDKFEAIGKSLKVEWLRSALSILCRKGEVEDLRRIRQVLRETSVDFEASHIDYLRKFGEWIDIELIVRLHSNRSFAILSGSPGYAQVSQAIYQLGRDRLPELLELEMSSLLRAALVIEISDDRFAQLPDATIAKLFHDEVSEVRKAAALKCVRSLPKSRITDLLNDYISAGTYRYYNVIHWLDLGASIPRDKGKAAATKAIAGEWAARWNR